MPRVHAIELLDQPWYPKRLRRYVCEYLALVWRLGGYDQALARELSELLEQTEKNVVVDLCSGAGGPIRAILQRIAPEKRPKVFSTDLFPLDEPSTDRIVFVHEPVDARNVPENLVGVRTLFAAFHHFRPDDARQILNDAVIRREPILIAEISSRNIRTAIGTVVSSLVGSAVMSLFFRPFRLERVLLSTVVPIIPMTLAFDGLVSCLRTYTPAELAQLTEGLESDGYELQWRSFSGSFPFPGLLLVGSPRS